MSGDILQGPRPPVSSWTDEEVHQAFDRLVEQWNTDNYTYPNLGFDLGYREQALFGSGVLHTTHDARLVGLLKSLDLSVAQNVGDIPELHDQYDYRQAVPRRDDVNKYLNGKVMKNKQPVKRGEEIPFSLIRLGTLERFKQTNDPIYQALDIVGIMNQRRLEHNQANPNQAVNTMTYRDYEVLVDDTIKAVFSEDIIRYYRENTGSLRVPIDLR